MNTTKHIIGIDTHKDTHTAAILNEKGKLLEVKSMETSDIGYTALLDWAQRFGEIDCFAIAVTSS